MTRLFFIFFSGVISAMPVANAVAADYPARPIRVIVPYPAGGPVDITIRAVSPRLTESLKQPFVIDNRGGAGGTIGADLVAKAAPDGYTLLACSTGNTINATLIPGLPYDFARDFTPVTMIAIITSILIVNPAVTRSVLFGVLLIAVMTVRPEGLFGQAKVEVV